MKQLVISISIALISITIFSSFFWDNLFTPDYKKIARAITSKTAEKIAKEKGLVPIGRGGGMIGDIYMMAISFNYFKEVDIRTARELLVYCVEEYLSAINADEKIRPFLHNYPFTAKNIEIRIFFQTPDNKDVPLGSMSGAASIEGKVSYYSNNQNGMTLNTIHKETYEEALKLVQNEPTKN